MKRFVSIILSAVLTTTLAIAGGFDFGIHNSRYIYAGYGLSHNYHLTVFHSMFSEKFGKQEVGGAISGKYMTGPWSIEGTAYGDGAWDGSYGNVGALAGASFRFPEIITLFAALNPHYDSGYGYKTCYRAGLKAHITKEIGVFTSYTTIPDYRKSEKRLHAGFTINSSTLTVEPALSFPIGGNTKLKSMRVLMSMRYQFSQAF